MQWYGMVVQKCNGCDDAWESSKAGICVAVDAGVGAFPLIGSNVSALKASASFSCWLGFEGRVAIKSVGRSKQVVIHAAGLINPRHQSLY